MAPTVPSRGLKSSLPLILSSGFFAEGSPVFPVETELSDAPECATEEVEDSFDDFFLLLLFFVRLEAPLE